VCTRLMPPAAGREAASGAGLRRCATGARQSGSGIRGGNVADPRRSSRGSHGDGATSNPSVRSRFHGVWLAGTGGFEDDRPKQGRPGVRAGQLEAFVSWKRDVAQAAGVAMSGGPLLEGPLLLELSFYVPRPKGHYGARGLRPSAPAYPTVKPDVLKLARAVEDALTGTLFRDDAQVVRELLVKVYGEPARCEVRVSPVDLLPRLEEEAKERKEQAPGQPQGAKKSVRPEADEETGRSDVKAADLVGVGRSTVAAAKAIQRRATAPEQLDLEEALDQLEGFDGWIESLPCPPWAERVEAAAGA
jgi:Holliday junction resolvase RusA-like endonuclease